MSARGFGAARLRRKLTSKRWSVARLAKLIHDQRAATVAAPTGMIALALTLHQRALFWPAEQQVRR